MLAEILQGFCIVILYFVCCVVILVAVRALLHPPSELFRKSLHIALTLSLFAWVYAFSHWWASVAAVVLFLVVVYPVLVLAEAKLPIYSKLLVERDKGEIRSSIVLACLMFASMIALTWGICGERILTFAVVFPWGFGDATAALVGKRFGKHKPKAGRFCDGKKSLEGSFGMLLVCFAILFVILLIRGGLGLISCAIAAMLTGFACTVVEFFSPNGRDTLFCPLATAATLLLLLQCLGGFS